MRASTRMCSLSYCFLISLFTILFIFSAIQETLAARIPGDVPRYGAPTGGQGAEWSSKTKAVGSVPGRAGSRFVPPKCCFAPPKCCSSYIFRCCTTP